MHIILISITDPDEPKGKEKRQKGGKSGFLAPLQLSDALVKFFGTGESTLSRADVVKRMWDYIKQNNLQVCCFSPWHISLYTRTCKICVLRLYCWQSYLFGGTSKLLVTEEMFLSRGGKMLYHQFLLKMASFLWMDGLKQSNSKCVIFLLMKDPSDKRRIICDEKLKELFDVDTFTGFTVSKLLVAHLVKAEQWISLIQFLSSPRDWKFCF